MTHRPSWPLPSVRRYQTRRGPTVAEAFYYPTTPEIATLRKELAPGLHDAFDNFSRAVFPDGALPEKTKQLIAVAVAHVTQGPYCITGHTKLAGRTGASAEEIMEAIWVAPGARTRIPPSPCARWTQHRLAEVADGTQTASQDRPDLRPADASRRRPSPRRSGLATRAEQEQGPHRRMVHTGRAVHRASHVVRP